MRITRRSDIKQLLDDFFENYVLEPDGVKFDYDPYAPVYKATFRSKETGGQTIDIIFNYGHGFLIKWIMKAWRNQRHSWEIHSVDIIFCFRLQKLLSSYIGAYCKDKAKTRRKMSESAVQLWLTGKTKES